MDKFSTSYSLRGKFNNSIIFDDIPVGSYYFSISAEDNDGFKKELIHNNFTVGNPKPTLEAPKFKVDVNGQEVTFSWNAVPNATQYDIRVNYANDTSYADYWDIKGTSKTVTLPANTEFKVNICSKNKNYENYWVYGTTISFKTGYNPFTITFDANGRNVSPTSKTVTYNQTYGDLPTPTKTGYTFTGWFTDANGGTQITSGTKVNITSNQTLYAHWQDNSAPTISKAEASDITISGFKLKADASDTAGLKSVTANVWTWKGYDVDGKNLSLSKSGDTWSCDVKVSDFNKTYGAYYYQIIATDVNGNITKSDMKEVKVGVFTVTFDPNSGTVDKNNQLIVYNYKYSEKGKLPVPAKSNYTFDGWYTDKTGGTKITDDTIVSVTSNQTLYAHWSKNEIMITFDAMGGESEVKTKRVTYDNKYGVLPTAEKAGYTFEGWYLDKEYTKPISESDVVKITANQSVYAKWSLQEYIVTFDGNGGTPDVKTKLVVYGKAYGVLPEATLKNDKFVGWFTADGTEIKSSDIVKLQSDIIVYAKWQSETVGDINLNGVIDSDDIILLNDYLLGRESLNKEQAEKADLTGDNIIDVFDLVAMRRTLVERNGK